MNRPVTQARLSWWAVTAALLSATAYFGMATGYVTGAVAMAILLSVNRWFPRIALEPPSDVAATAMLAALAGALVFLFPIPIEVRGRETIIRVWTAAAAAALAAGVFRQMVVSPKGGERATLGLSLIAVVAMAANPTHPYFLPFLALMVLLLLGALRLVDPYHAFSLKGSELVRHGASILVAAGVAAGLMNVLPKAHDQVIRATGRWLLGSGFTQSGFSTRLALGGMKNMIDSNEVVLRIDGVRPDHLRGIVYTRYSQGQWFSTLPASPQPLKPRSLPPDLKSTTIHSVGGETGRYFVPKEAHTFSSSEALRQDPGGILWPSAQEKASTVSFLFTDGTPRSILGPTEDDAAVPPQLKAKLQSLARKWTHHAKTPLAQLAAIEAQLDRDFEYSLEYERPPGTDPILDFLFAQRLGHCEYFASGMALLARSLGISTRVIGGFRVSEENPLTGQYLVRGKNAHAWVEAWIPGIGWKTFDPTPAAALAEQMPSKTAGWAAYSDALRAGLAAFIGWVKNRSGPEYAALFLFAVLFLFRREVLALLRHRRPARRRQENIRTGPPPAYAKLVAVLAEQGFVRAPSEPIESFADRVTVPPEAADLIKRYAAWRYSGQSAHDPVLDDIAAWCERRGDRHPRRGGTEQALRL